jgi:serine/threonine protein kinase
MVAIKTILAKTESTMGRESRERFRREARSAGVLSHPNIVTIHDFSDSGDPMFIAMEFVEGCTLAEAMSNGPLSIEMILGVLRSASDALDYAHAQHIVHRDIKPANFLINNNGRLKITDFGIAKILDSDEGLTSTGMLVGTAQYMSPEQVSEGHITGRSDQFSLAVIAYEMLTGVKPFQGNSWASVIHAIIMEEPASITRYRHNLSEAVNTVLRKALAKDPAGRYPTCSAFCGALERTIVGESVDQTAVFAKPQVPSAVPARQEEPHVPTQQSSTDRPNTNQEITREVIKGPAIRPLLIGAFGGAVIAAGLWLGLRSKPAPPAAPVVVQQPKSPPPQLVQVAAPTPPPKTEVPKTEVPAATREPVVKQVPKQVREKPSPTPVAIARPTPAEIPKAVAPPVVTPVVTAQQVPTPTPAPIPVIAPPKPQVDPAKRAAEEQAKRAADDQARRSAEEQTKRAADDQAKRLADDQAKSIRAADNAAISKVLITYQAAYERKDPSALQTIWPSIPKLALEGIRSSFRDASEVSMELHSVGDPKISGATATVICDRNLRQVILKRVLQASNRVKIVLVRAGGGWVIQSVEAVKQ